MSKLFIRLTIILVSLYLIACSVCEFLFQINIWSHTYTLMFELCVCLCLTAQGKYHCQYIRWTAYAIFAADAIITIDELFDVFSYNAYVLIPPIIVAVGLLTTTTLAIRHYIHVKKMKRIWKIKK